MHQHFQGVDGFRCGDEQDVTLFSTETDVGCPVLGNGEMGNLLPVLVEYGHAVAGQIDVSTVVYRHSVRSHVGKHLAVSQLTVGLDVVSQDSVRPCLGHIQLFSIGRSNKTIGLVKR